jgi:TIR domain
MTAESPKLFISYSWSNDSHEQWVIDLATELRQNGVDVKLDKWDLKEGHDAVHFMEQMVRDPKIKKVAMIVDKTYAEKANDRSGGVGTETQIISAKVYESQEQNKFVVVTTERDGEGKPYKPIYYASRIYIDFCDHGKYAEKFEQLMRWINDKPFYQKPELGKLPEYIASENPVILPTSGKLKRAIDLMKNERSGAVGATQEYLETLAIGLEKFRIKSITPNLDDDIIKSIEEFTPYKTEFVELVTTISRYSLNTDCIYLMHRFFESLIPYMFHSKDVRTFTDQDYDNFKFIIHELYLYSIALFLKFEKFEFARLLVEQQFYVKNNSEVGPQPMHTYRIFWQYLSSFESRNKRLSLKKISLHADILEQRSKTSGIDFQFIMQADFLLYIRSELESKDNYDKWWPITLSYLGHRNGAFEIFARATSTSYFHRIGSMIGVKSKTELVAFITEYSDGKRQAISLDHFRSINPANLLNFEKLCTLP